MLTLLQLEGKQARCVCVRERENEYVYSSLWLIRYSIAAVNAKYDFSSNRFISSLITVHHNEQGGLGTGLVSRSYSLLQWWFTDCITGATLKMEISDQ